MLKRLIPVAVLIVGILMASFGFAAAQDDGLVFRMVSHGGPGNPFWTVVIKGQEDACALLGADCLWLGDEQFSLEGMAGYWEDALASNPDGIGTTVPDPEVIRSGVETAADLGIPVIVYNTADPNAGADPAVLVPRARVVSVRTETTNGLVILSVQVPAEAALPVAQASAVGAVAVTLLPVGP